MQGGHVRILPAVEQRLQVRKAQLKQRKMPIAAGKEPLVGKETPGVKHFSLFRFVSLKQSKAALLYMFFSLACMAIVLSVADKLIIPAFEDSGALDSGHWRDQDNWLLEQRRRKNQASLDCAVWRSEAWPVSEVKSHLKRILVMGDSFVWGTGYPNMNTLWWRRLQKVLKERGYNDVEVIAAGLPAQSTATQLQEARKIVGKYKPDMIIWGYVTNDPDEVLPSGQRIVPLMRRWNEPLDDFPAALKQGIEGAFPNLAWHLFDMRRSARLRNYKGTNYGYDYGTWELKLLEGENFQHYETTVKNTAQFVRELNVPSFAITLPAGFQSGDNQRGTVKGGDLQLSKMHDYHVRRYEKVQSLFNKSGLPFYNTLDDVTNGLKQNLSTQELSALQLGINPANGHPAASLCHQYAICAANILEKNYPKVLGPKTDGKSMPPSRESMTGFRTACNSIACLIHAMFFACRKQKKMRFSCHSESPTLN